MAIQNVRTDKPIEDLTAKVASESASVTMEAPELPEFYHSQITKNLCVVSVARAAEQTKGGIIIADQSREATNYASQIGRIEAVGPMFYNEKRWGTEEAEAAPRIGDFVMFEPYVGRRFQLEDNEFLIIEDTNILIKKLDPTHDFKLFT